MIARDAAEALHLLSRRRLLPGSTDDALLLLKVLLLLLLLLLMHVFDLLRWQAYRRRYYTLRCGLSG